jgi:hypothetical protein
MWNQDLYNKAVEHNHEVHRLKDSAARCGLVLGPVLLVLGAFMVLYPEWFKKSQQAGFLSEYFYDKAVSASFLLGVAFPYLSIRWLLKRRNTGHA